MKNSEAVKMVRRHRGPIFAGVLAAHDVVYFEMTKAAVLRTLGDYDDHSELFDLSDRDGALYIDNAVVR